MYHLLTQLQGQFEHAILSVWRITLTAFINVIKKGRFWNINHDVCGLLKGSINYITSEELSSEMTSFLYHPNIQHAFEIKAKIEDELEKSKTIV